MPKNVNINGKPYAMADLSAEAKQLLQNVGMAEAKLAQLKQEAAMVQTARNSYARALVQKLPK